MQKRFRPPFGFRPFLSKCGQAFGDFRVRLPLFGRASCVLKNLCQIPRGALRRSGIAQTTGKDVESAVELCELLGHSGACRLSGEGGLEPLRDIRGQVIEGRRCARLNGRSQRPDLMIDGLQCDNVALRIRSRRAIEFIDDFR